jgi:hypothetical protein
MGNWVIVLGVTLANWHNSLIVAHPCHLISRENILGNVADPFVPTDNTVRHRPFVGLLGSV